MARGGPANHLRSHSRKQTWSSPDGREARSAEPVGRARPRLVRVLSAEDARDGGQSLGGGEAARTARPGFRLGHLRRRRLDARAHPRDGGAARARNDDEACRASDLRRRVAGRNPRDPRRLSRRRRAPHRGAARRSVRRASTRPTRRIPTATGRPPNSSPTPRRSAISRSRSGPIPRSIRRARLSCTTSRS